MASPALRQTSAVTLSDVQAAARRIEGAVVRTPTQLSRTLSDATGASVYVKFENLQFTAAYKERGALNRLLLMDEAVRARGVIAASAGNHAQAVAYHGARLGVPVTIVMPIPTPSVKVMQTESHGATIVLHGETFDEAYAEAMRLAAERDLTFVHPFDDLDVIAGQGTVALEMLADAPDLEVLLVPIGGGGLISGIATAVKWINPDIELLGVQAQLYPSMYCSVTGKNLASAGDTIAEGIAVKEPGRRTAEIVRALVDEILLVTEPEIETAISLLLQIEKTVVEGAGAAGLAALLANGERFRGRKVGIILTGGNIDTRLLATVLLRDLVRSGRMARLRIQLQDRPGAMLSVVKLFDQHQVNIIEIFHQRIFTALPAKDTFIDIECEARDAEHLQGLVRKLEQEGFSVHPVEIG
ncbi:threonine ammonia-lyase [Sphingosinicella rhizophila]|uniref:Threonine ammonia-lyase n=1 Tax=Sphingosinicella rhizophila TaxID=3050082 RepID=A0ABU3Q3H2_9SPHN|nr:threonine ammonia-lyase [Sphingosinicella sp. GR2756]MDT9597963.1 threonine ammonia-lyase [Sphingosinicella sp. GR2756]